MPAPRWAPKFMLFDRAGRRGRNGSKRAELQASADLETLTAVKMRRVYL
jgi:hypothetical protein